VKAYLSVFRLRFVHGLQYRAAAVAGIATQFAFGFLFLSVFLAFQAANPGASTFGRGPIATYVWLTQAFLVLVATWYRDGELLDTIVSGNLAYEYCRPLDLHLAWFFRLTAHRVAAVLLRCAPILGAAWFLPAPYTLAPPASAEALALFLATLAGGLAVVVALGELLYIGTIVTQTPAALFLLVGTLADFGAGLVVPLPFLPDGVREVLAWLPFRLTADLPFRTWSGDIAPPEAWAGLGAQVVWFFVLFGAGRLLLGRIGRRLVVQGG
jgi:ABC-2 type transport system permease protein